MRVKKKERGWGDAPYEPWNEIAPDTQISPVRGTLSMGIIRLFDG